MLDKKSKQLFCKLLKENKKFVVSGHQGPDGDVVGSTLAMVLGLKKLGKKVLAFNHDGCPNSLKFLPKSGEIRDQIPEEFKNAVLITVDSGDLERLGSKIGAEKFSEVWNVDHHKSNTKFGDYNFIDVKAGSTGQVVWELLSACRGFKLTKDIAQNLFCTLSTDTGSFRYSNATSDVFNMAAKLVEAGAKPDVVSQALYETYPQKRLVLLQVVLQSLKFEMGGKLALMFLTKNDLDATGATGEESDEFVNFPRGVSGVKIVGFFKEKSPLKWKVSLRSRDNVDVLKIAQKYGGGGHSLAAGCMMDGDREVVKRTLEETILELGSF